MRAEAVSWDDWSASNASPIADDDRWHVAFAPGEVKVVSLEQLDDLYRLSIVDAETQVWQPGMGEWQPLRVIAGIDDQPPAPPPQPKRTHPKPPSPRSSPPPPRPASVLSLALASTPPASFYPAAVSVAPAAVRAAPAPISVAAPVAPVQLNSVRPLVVSRAPTAPPRGGGFGRLLVGLALVAGVGISLYRNGVLRDAAHSTRQDALYAQLESALGGPAFGTLSALDQIAGAANAPPASEDVAGPASRPASADGKALPLAAAALPAPLAAGSTPPVVSLESLAHEKKSPLSSAPAAAPAVAAPAVARSLAAPSAAQAVRQAAFPAKGALALKTEAPAPAKSEAQMSARDKLNAAIGRSMSSTPPSSKSKSKASEYDPLNPKL